MEVSRTSFAFLFLGKHVLFCFGSYSFALLCSYDKVRFLGVNFMMDVTGKWKKYTILLLNFLVSWSCQLLFLLQGELNFKRFNCKSIKN